MTRLARLATLLALVAAAVVVVLVLLSPEPATEPVADLRTEAPRAAAPTENLSARPMQGGVYGGHVLDLEGQPIHGAHVLLISYDAGSPNMLTAGSGVDREPGEFADVPVLGAYREGGEGITDADGAFRIAADSQSSIARVLAYQQGYFLAVTDVDRPRDDLELRLQRGGKVVGTVVDAGTGAPIQGARVDIYLQQKVDPVPEDTEGQGNYRVIHRARHETAWLATLGRFTSKVLGPRIWGVTDSGSETLQLVTDANGHFEIGPLGNTVQLEFVVTHPLYAWHDFDTDGGKHAAKRTVVEPGETVEREFRLPTGHHVAGQVVDESGQGVPDVQVKVQCVSAYFHHWWYRDKWRRTITDGQGRFRVDGLTEGSQQIVFQHPSFKEKTTSVDRVPADDLLVVADRFGALAGRIQGAALGSGSHRITVFFESRAENPQDTRQFRRTEAVRASGEFLVQRIPPGAYRVWVQIGKSSSQPTDVDVVALEMVTQDFELGAGGIVLARVVDENGGVVDPASLRLVSLQGDAERTLGTFVARAGEIEIEGVAPGRYRLLVQAPGRIEVKTEPFEVSEARSASLGVIQLRRWGFLRLGTPVNRLGRPVKLAADTVVEMQVGDGPWERILNAGVDRTVRPGPVRIRARSGEMRFEQEVEVRGGETTEVPIVFDDGR